MKVNQINEHYESFSTIKQAQKAVKKIEKIVNAKKVAEVDTVNGDAYVMNSEDNDAFVNYNICVNDNNRFFLQFIVADNAIPNEYFYMNMGHSFIVIK